jgi:hypothetical protein
MLPDGIPELREFVESYMYEVTEVQRSVTTEEEEGYPRTSLQTVETTKSLAQPVGQRELLRAQQAGFEVESRRFLPAGTYVTLDDVLVVDGEKWNVTGIPEFTEELSAHTEVYLVRRG